MQFDTRMILAGQTPDIVGSAMNGAALAESVNGIQRQNALARLYQQQGPGIMAGQQNALNALAAMDPAAALGIQDARQTMQQRDLSMQADRQRMDMLTREEQRQLQEYAASKSTAELQAETDRLEGMVKMGLGFHQAGDKAGYEAFLRQNGADPASAPFEQIPMLARRFMSMADVMKMGQGSQQGDRFKVVGSQLVDLNAEGGPRAVLTAPGQEEVVFGPDGKPIVARGPVGTGAKFTEAQSKDITFATRARGALQALEPVAGALASRSEMMAEQVPLGLGREMQSSTYQVARNAGDEFLQAILRKDTGAAITEPEQMLYGKTYLPQPGDGPEVLAQKSQARRRALAAMEAGMPPEAIVAQERALQASRKATQIDGFTIEAIE